MIYDLLFIVYLIFKIINDRRKKGREIHIEEFYHLKFDREDINLNLNQFIIAHNEMR